MQSFGVVDFIPLLIQYWEKSFNVDSLYFICLVIALVLDAEVCVHEIKYSLSNYSKYKGN